MFDERLKIALPDARRAAPTSGHHIFIVRGKIDPHDHPAIALIDSQIHAGCRVPKTNRSIGASGQQEAIIRRKSNAVDNVSVTNKITNLLPSIDVPDARYRIPSSGGDITSIVGEGYLKHG